ncbi:MAG: hypothetical protein ACLGJA_11430 [Gammaproteobacteria bacterium]
MKPNTQAVSLNRAQWLIIVTSALPIYAIALCLPTQAHAQGELALVLQQVLEQHLLGRVGPWSSNFPLQAMAIGNYIALAAPLFAVVLALLLCRSVGALPARLPVLAWHRYLLIYVGWALLVGFMIHYNYFTYVDFAQHRAKFRLFGRHPLLFAVFASSMLLALEYLLLISYLLFIHFPARWLAQRLGKIWQ